MVAELTDHIDTPTMYLMSVVNSTFVGRRPTGHVELVDLSVEKKKAVERYKEQNGNLRGYGGRRSSAEVDNLKPTASPRSHRARHDRPGSDLCLEPLFPLFLGSPSSDSSEADTALRGLEARVQSTQDTETLSCSTLADTSPNVVEKTLATVSPKEEMPRIADMQLDMAIDGSKTIKPSKTIVTPKLESLFSDGGVSTRVKRHPLEMTVEQEHDRDEPDSSPRTKRSDTSIPSKNSPEKAVREKIAFSARVLQHPLERIDESPVKERRVIKERPLREIPVKESPTAKERKPTMKKERKNAATPPPQPVRKLVRDLKPDVKQPQKRERAKLRESRAPITKPRSPKLASEKRPEANEQERPSLANPVLEKMPPIASPEPPYAWNKKFQNLPKLAVSSVDTEPMMEERELRYSSPKMTESDAQDDLSFRAWERESKPKRKSISVSRDFQDCLDLESSQDLEENTKTKEKLKSSPERSSSSPGKGKTTVNVKALPHVSTVDLRRKSATPNVEVDIRHCEDEIQHGYPSPSSFTCGLSPTSLFSDDDNMFSRFQQFPNSSREEATTLCKSPRSVLPQEPDETSHFASDSSIETRETPHRYSQRASTYNDESSDLESPMDGAKNREEAELNRRSFATFTYTDKQMAETSSDEEGHSAEFSELRYFQEAGNREPWLGSKDGGVLDDTDLQFLLPPDFKDNDANPHEETVSEISEVSTRGSPRRASAWVPYVTSTKTSHHSRSASFDTTTPENPPQRPPKRSVKFAPNLVQEIPISPSKNSIRLPRPESYPARDDDEQIYPSVKSWEVEEEDNSSAASTPRRRWRRSPKPSTPDHVDMEGDASPSITASRRRWRKPRDETPGRRHRVAHLLPCAGRLLSWPHRAFKVSRSRRLDSDDESVAGNDHSFGRSARRDAQQLRRILKGSQKKFSNLTVADILDENFTS